MKNGWPSKEEDIDIFFKNNLADATEPSALDDLLWDKISHKLDLANVGTMLDNSSVVSSSGKTVISNANNSISFLSTLGSVKGIVTAGVTCSVVVSGYFYVSSINNLSVDKTPETDSSSSSVVISDSSNIIKNSSSDTIQYIDHQNIVNVPSEKEDKINSNTVEDGSPQKQKGQETIITESTPEENKQNNIQVPVNTNPPESISEKEVQKSEPAIVEKEDPQPSIQQPANFHEKIMEQAKKKSRPIFVPKKDSTDKKP